MADSASRIHRCGCFPPATKSSLSCGAIAPPGVPDASFGPEGPIESWRRLRVASDRLSAGRQASSRLRAAKRWRRGITGQQFLFASAQSPCCCREIHDDAVAFAGPVLAIECAHKSIRHSCVLESITSHELVASALRDSTYQPVCRERRRNGGVAWVRSTQTGIGCAGPSAVLPSRCRRPTVLALHGTYSCESRGGARCARCDGRRKDNEL